MKNVLITGAPGIGKTTLVKKLIKKLTEAGTEIDGFLTEEVRNDRNQRIGFNVQLFKHNISKTLADKSHFPPNDSTRKLGQYTVYVKQFEDIVIEPIQKFEKGVLIIDEIGKMELFSATFEQVVSEAFKNKKFRILATVPIKGPPFVERLKRDSGCQLFTVTEHNRENLLDKILEAILTGMK